MNLLLKLSIEYLPEPDILRMYVFMISLGMLISLGLMAATPEYILSLVHATLRSLLLILLVLQMCRYSSTTFLLLVLLQIESLS
jgi:hypothetical protein